MPIWARYVASWSGRTGPSPSCARPYASGTSSSPWPDAKVTSSDAEVHTLPRRVRLERTEVAGATGAQGRTVIDLPAEEPAMPNFEADRRRA